jgi:hypothetical protein
MANLNALPVATVAPAEETAAADIRVTAPSRGRLRANRLAVWIRRAAVPLTLFVASGLLATSLVRLGWMPNDDGLLAHSAERVLQGDLPNRDFDDAYTGGLAMAEAAVFRVLDTRLDSLRLPLIVGFALFVVAVYTVARRFTSTSGAVLVAALAGVWTMPSYPNGGPSWYQMFLFMGGMAALCLYAERRHPFWLALAGLAGGLSITIKVIGFYYVAAALLFFVFLEQQDDAAAAADSTTTRLRHGPYSVVVSVLLVAFVAALFRMVRHLEGVVGPPLHFVLPSAALVAVLLAREWRTQPHRSSFDRTVTLIRHGAPFLVGVFAPIALFLLPYIRAGAIHDLVYGVFVLPQKRFQFAAHPPASLRTAGWAIPWLALLLIPARRLSGNRGVVIGLVLLAAAIPMVLDGGVWYRSLWRTLNHVDWVVVVVGAGLFASQETLRRWSPQRVSLVWLALCMCALANLDRFPQAGAIYLLFLVPFAALAILAILTTRTGGSGPVPAMVGVMLLVVAIGCVAARRFDYWGNRLEPLSELVPIGGPRGGIFVSPSDRDDYTRAVALLQAHSAPNSYIYAGPDLPEVYFLSGRRDPRHTMYDFFDDPRTHDASVLEAIDTHQVTAVAIHSRDIMWSQPMDADLLNALRQRFPDSAAMGPLIVRWRQAPATSPSAGG